MSDPASGMAASAHLAVKSGNSQSDPLADITLAHSSRQKLPSIDFGVGACPRQNNRI
jgi:hypothetical protein